MCPSGSGAYIKRQVIRQGHNSSEIFSIPFSGIDLAVWSCSQNGTEMTGSWTIRMSKLLGTAVPYAMENKPSLDKNQHLLSRTQEHLGKGAGQHSSAVA